LYGTIDRLRNYHSHYIHEPGILSFKDLFDTDKTLSQSEFDDAKAWFQKRFDDAKNHLLQSLNNRKEKLTEQKQSVDEEERKIINKKIKQIGGVINDFNKMSLLDDKKHLTVDGQLFIACIFLYKRQAKIILDKWRGLKNIDGYQNTLHTFYTYYSLRENYSINNYNDNLLKFRNITSKLSVLPYSDNPSLSFIYDKVKELNEVNNNEIDEFPEGLNQKIISLEAKLKKDKSENVERELESFKNQLKQKQDLQKRIIPYRKNPVFTQILLQYILDNDLIKDSNNIKIAIKKTYTDSLEYIEKHPELDAKENLTALKNRIKEEKDIEKKHKLIEHIKELKRNFIFKTHNELEELQKIQKLENNDFKPPKGFNFSTKKYNALFQFNIDGNVVNVTIPPDLLLKWIFIHIEKKENTGLEIIQKFVKERVKKLTYTDVDKIYDYYSKKYSGINIKKLLPKSIRHSSHPVDIDLKSKTKNHIENRIKVLEEFISENKQQSKPWKFAAKRKIDVILQYIHFKLMYDVYINRIDTGSEDIEDFIRHKSFNMEDYNTAREYFRFFGRYENDTIHNLDKSKQEYVLPAVIKKMKQENRNLFAYIKEDIDASVSLENLFENVIDKQIKLLSNINKSFDKYKLDDLIRLFKIDKISNKNNVNSLLKTQYVRSFALSDDIISLKDHFIDEWQAFVNKKNDILKSKGKEGNFNYSEFAFARDYLWEIDKPDTNIDFILKKIIPQTGKKLTPTIFKQLLKIKTQELMLWRIAKNYWFKANKKEYLLDTIVSNHNKDAFQEFCFFNKVYNQTLDYPIVIGDRFWNEKNKIKFKKVYDILPDDNKTLSFTIKIPARKYDAKFLMVERKLIKEYVLWHHLDEVIKSNKLPESFDHNDFKQTFNLNNYEDLMKMINKELIQSITDIYQILRAEKKIIDNNKDEYLELLGKKYKDINPITDFYISIKNIDGTVDKYLFDSFVNRANNDEKETAKEYLTLFRNYALHYQLQDPERKKIVLNFLKKINSKLDANEYYVTKD